MKKTLLIFCVVLLCGNMLATQQGKIESITAQQRYPWNGLVDVDCTLSGDEASSYALLVSAKDKVGGTNLVVNAVSVEGDTVTNNPVSVSAGNCHLIWNAGMDLPNGFRSDQVSISVTVSDLSKKFMVVDLSSGEVSYQAEAPDEGWEDNLYKITKMVFQRIEPTTFNQVIDGVYTRKVTLSKAFYVAIYPLTEGQVETINGNSSTSTSWAMYSLDSGDSSPRYAGISQILRGSMGAWPKNGHDVTSSSVIGILRTKTGMDKFDMPTLAQMCLASDIIEWNSEGCIALDNYQNDLGPCAVVDPVGPRYYDRSRSYRDKAVSAFKYYPTLVKGNQQWCDTDTGSATKFATRLCLYETE